MMNDELKNNQVFSLQDDNGEDAITFATVWDAIWNHKGCYILSLAICLVLGFAYIYHTPERYQSRESFILDDDQNSSSILSDFSNSARRRYSQHDQNVANEMYAFRSPDLMQKVVERLGLELNYTDLMFFRKRDLYNRTPFIVSVLNDDVASSFSFIVSKTGSEEFVLKDFKVAGQELESNMLKGSFGDSLVTPVGSVCLTRSPYFSSWHDDVEVSWAQSSIRARSYLSRLGVMPAKDESTVITLTMTDYNGERAKNVLETLFDIYNEQWIANKNRSAQNTSEFINNRLVIIEKELGGIENDIKVYKQENRITDVNAVADQYLQQSSTYAGKAFETSNQLAITQFIKDYLNDPNHARSLIPANSGLVNENIEGQILLYNEALMKRDRLLQSSSEANPMVADLNNQLDAMKTNINRSVENHIATLQLQHSKISAQENSILGRMASTSGQQLQLLSMDRQQKVKESLYLYLLQKREENELSAQVNVGNTRLILSPSSGYKVFPSVKNTLALALLVGFLIPFAIFFLAQMLDTKVHTRADLAKVGIPFLAEIPLAGSAKRRLFRSISRKAEVSNTSIVVKSGSRDSMNEAFRVLRTNLDMMFAKKDSCHVIMVSSFNPGAGKTFSIMNMAASMAVKGSKVLLLDLDLRKATLSKTLKMNTTGVTSYLNEKSDSWRPLVQTVSDNLSLMSVGTLPPNPAELLVSDRFAEMIDQMRGEFDYIFLDCPPVEIVADASIISSSADITVFIIRAEMFDKRALPALEHLYAEGKFKRMALILNGVEEVYRSYGKYGYGYGYGYGSYGYGYGEGADKA